VSHVEQVLTVAKQRKIGLSRAALYVYNTIILSVVTYALPSLAGQLSKADKGRLDRPNLFPKLSGEGFVAKHSPLMTSYRLEIKNYFTE